MILYISEFKNKGTHTVLIKVAIKINNIFVLKDRDLDSGLMQGINKAIINTNIPFIMSETIGAINCITFWIKIVYRIS